MNFSIHKYLGRSRVVGRLTILNNTYNNNSIDTERERERHTIKIIFIPLNLCKREESHKILALYSSYKTYIVVKRGVTRRLCSQRGTALKRHTNFETKELLQSSFVWVMWNWSNMSFIKVVSREMDRQLRFAKN